MLASQKIAGNEDAGKGPDLFRISSEIESVAAIATCLHALFSGDCDKPSDEILGAAMFGVDNYLTRLAKEVESGSQY